MSLDVKNIIRLDLQDIFDDARERSFHIVQALDAQGKNGSDESYHPDVYAISDNETNLLYRFIATGSSKISNYASMIKHHNQTGIDALTHYTDLECPTDADSYIDPDSETEGDEYITDPDNKTALVKDIHSKQHVDGEKLSSKIGDTVIFSIDGLQEDVMRYTMAQQFIRDALVEYALYEWFKLKGVGNQAIAHLSDYERIAGDIRFNAVINHKRKGYQKKMGPVI